MTALSVHVKAWTAWLPETDGRPEWQPKEGARSADFAATFQPPANDVPVLLKRRISPLGRRALQAAWGLKDAEKARFVFASRNGEFGRTLTILDALVRKVDVSPADFSLSVQHALAGLLSIARANHLGHTSVAAGRESLCSGILEAAVCLTERPAEPVILLYYDEPLPVPYDAFNAPEEETIVLALALTRGGDQPGLQVSYRPAPPGAPIDPRPGERLLAFLGSDVQQTTITGDRLAWRFEKTDAQP